MWACRPDHLRHSAGWRLHVRSGRASTATGGCCVSHGPLSSSCHPFHACTASRSDGLQYCSRFPGSPSKGCTPSRGTSQVRSPSCCPNAWAVGRQEAAVQSGGGGGGRAQQEGCQGCSALCGKLPQCLCGSACCPPGLGCHCQRYKVGGMRLWVCTSSDKALH